MTIAKSSSQVSNWRIMRTLIAKDCRFFRAPIVAMVVATIGAYMIFLSQISFDNMRLYPEPSWRLVLNASSHGSFFAMLLAGLLASAFGGSAFAKERKDKTLDFLAVLPVSRVQIIISKLLIAGVAIILFTMAPMIIGTKVFEHEFSYYQPEQFSFANRWAEWAFQTSFTLGFAISLYTFAGLVVSLFGIAWLLSTFTQSAAVSSCISLAITLGTFVLIEYSDALQHSHPQTIICVATLAIGGPSLLGGTMYYLNRIAP